MAADDDGAGGVGGESHQGDDLQRLLSAMGEADGKEEGVGGLGAQDRGRDLAPAEEGGRVPRTVVARSDSLSRTPKKFSEERPPGDRWSRGASPCFPDVQVRRDCR